MVTTPGTDSSSVGEVTDTDRSDPEGLSVEPPDEEPEPEVDPEPEPEVEPELAPEPLPEPAE